MQDQYRVNFWRGHHPVGEPDHTVLVMGAPTRKVAEENAKRFIDRCTSVVPRYVTIDFSE